MTAVFRGAIRLFNGLNDVYLFLFFFQAEDGIRDHCVTGGSSDLLFKAAATRASVQPGPFQDFYHRSLAKGIKPTMVRLTLARKIAAITLTLWKKGENFDADKLKSQAA